ncbi:MFS transporter [Candidatus Poribacteria bacterium]|nr:MFS transporter [Candidatus Poribacteria bacterium]MBT5535552.1 MFS transporter [Candidatus Poribacteria bacterium]MBT5711687.1 MFS transporter [Candidatus Poribacteria bacterium]MBT7804043.1 MFS transporter [Candidatus Poribacteria bacterium]
MGEDTHAQPSTGPKARWRFADVFDLSVMGATHGISDGYSSLLVPILAMVVLDLGLTTFQAGLLLSAKSVATVLFLYPNSLLADRTNRKKEILLVGMTIASLAYVVMGWAPGLYTAILVAFVAGAGNSTYHPCGTALTAERFPRQRAVAISVHSLAGHLGASIMPLAQSAVVALLGWRTSLRVCALPAAVLLPLVAARMGRGSSSLREQREAHSPESFRQITARVLSNRNVVVLALVYALTALGTSGMVGFLPLLGSERFGLNQAVIGLAVSAYFTAGVFAKPVMGLMYNRLGARTALFVPLVCAGALAGVIGWLSWGALFIPLAALVGLVTPVSPIILTAAADVSDEKALASSIGFIYTCHGLGFLSPLVGGALAGPFGLSVSYTFFAVAIWAGAAAALLLRPAANA